MSFTKVLIVGNIEPYAIENYYVRYLVELGVSVSSFNLSDYFNHRSLVFRIRNRISDLSIYSHVNNELINFCNLNKPDIIWIFKGVEVFTETLYLLKKQGFYLVNYNPDHPFIRTSIAHGGKHVEDSVPIYDMHLTYIRALCEKFKNEFKKTSYWLPFGYDLYNFNESELDLNSMNEKVAFIGNPDKIRQSKIQLLQRSGIKVDVFGHNWNNWIKKSKNVEVNGPLYGAEFWQKIYQYKVHLNIFRPHNIGSHNMRSFEIPSVGGVQLAPNSDEHSYFFKPEREIFLYNSDSEMLVQLEKILSMGLRDLNEIRIQSKNRCKNDNYDYKNRAKYVAEVFKLI